MILIKNAALTKLNENEITPNQWCILVTEDNKNGIKVAFEKTFIGDDELIQFLIGKIKVEKSNKFADLCGACFAWGALPSFSDGICTVCDRTLKQIMLPIIDELK